MYAPIATHAMVTKHVKTSGMGSLSGKPSFLMIAARVLAYLFIANELARMPKATKTAPTQGAADLAAIAPALETRRDKLKRATTKPKATNAIPVRTQANKVRSLA